MSAAWAQVIATLVAPFVTISVAAVTALWTLSKWRDEREEQRKEERKQRKEEQLRLATLYINPFLIACEGLQSRLYNILERGGLGPLRKHYPGGEYAEDILYFIVQYFGWQQTFYRYYYDPQIIRLLEELRDVFATDKPEYGGVGPFCFFRSQQRAFGDMIMLRTEGPFGSEFVTKDYNEFLRMLKEDPFASSESLQKTLETLRTKGIPAEVRPRLVRIQNLLVDLLEYLEGKEDISFFTKEGGRKRAGDRNEES
jgi:hypothetical protein